MECWSVGVKAKFQVFSFQTKVEDEDEKEDEDEEQKRTCRERAFGETPNAAPETGALLSK